MKQTRNLGDYRQTIFCVHCGRSTETRDHAPSKIFLDKPYPENLPVLPCCGICNEGFSLDEQYMACFIESAICGSTNPDELKRDKIKRIFKETPKLQSRIDRSKKEAPTIGGGKIVLWNPEEKRIRKVVLKLARCHAAHELNEPRIDKPRHVMITPISLLDDHEIDKFETLPNISVSPEVGSRAMLNFYISDEEAYSEGWIIAQEARYRYMAIGTNEIVIRGVLSEYLAFEVIWQ